MVAPTATITSIAICNGARGSDANAPTIAPYIAIWIALGCMLIRVRVRVRILQGRGRHVRMRDCRWGADAPHATSTRLESLPALHARPSRRNDEVPAAHATGTSEVRPKGFEPLTF